MDSPLPAADASLQDLIRYLPFPLVLFATGSAIGFANDRFAEVYAPGQLESPDLQRVTQRPGGGWRPVALSRRDGAGYPARAQAVAVQFGVLVVIDDAPGQLSAEEYGRLQQRISELESLSATDRLTGAWNRVQLERTIDLEMSRASRLSQSVTLVLLDIDHFKRVNDVHGHLVGDAVLKEFVVRIRSRMRATDSLFRWGGEEFVMLAVACGYRGGAVLAEGLREAIAAESFKTVGPITASLGVAEYMEAEGADSWFHRTDQALYAAKAGGRNRVHVDRRGSSDLYAEQPGIGVLRLNWLEAYESGEPAIDAEHRELFDLGNALIAAATRQDSSPGAWRPALDSLLTHVARHFRNEEAVLALHGYEELAEHQRAHTGLLKRAGELHVAASDDESTLGTLVNFIVRDVIARHLFKVDRKFFPLFRTDGSATTRART
jgi:diguanylate cyclase (GGDEF)-like protein/hemerythrin-like metal-binding protein